MALSAFATLEMALEPTVVAAGAVFSGSAVTAAGVATAVAGFASMPTTGPFGAVVGFVGIGVAATGAVTATVGVDIAVDQARHSFDLSPNFDVIESFDFFSGH